MPAGCSPPWSRDRGGLVPELTDVRRFVNPWEKEASVELRAGSTDAIDAYASHGRVVAGTRDEMLDALYGAWKQDIEAGKTTLMIAADLATVNELNARAQADRIAAGAVSGDGVTVSGGATAGVGDQVVTRQNDRRLSTGKHWVRNGDQWRVIESRCRWLADPATTPWPRDGPRAGGLRARARRARLRLDRPSGAGDDGRHRARHGRTDHHQRGPLRLGHPGQGGQPPLCRHPLRPRSPDLPR